MGNTEFFRQASDLQTNFKWKEIFAEVGKQHTDEQKDKLLISGCKTFMPNEGNMLKEWQRPFMFFKFGIIGLIFVALLSVATIWVQAASFYPLLLVVPAFLMPLTILIFFWEMNVPRNISILELIKDVMYAGFVSSFLTFILRDVLMISESAPAYIQGPLPEEIAKFLMVYVLIKKLDCKYVLNGLLIGCAVGVGFAAQESAGYAINQFTLYGDMAMHKVNLMRGITAVGGHSVWAAMYGAALVHEKKKETLKIAHVATSSVLIAFFSAFGLHFVWNFPLGGLLGSDNLEWVKYVALTIVAWCVIFKWMRNGLVQVIEIGNRMMRRKVSINCVQGVLQGTGFDITSKGSFLIGRDGAAALRFPPNTNGISGRHCEVVMDEKETFLIDRGSTYGTFFADGTKLVPHTPYPVTNGTTFYLASKDNRFEIRM